MIFPKKQTTKTIKQDLYRMIQGALFGHDNLDFNTVNLPTKQSLTNICKKFSIKQIIKINPIALKLINLS